jgi:hypothetical protein
MLRREPVVVLGLGFVGTAVAANLARTLSGPSASRRAFFVIGLEMDYPAGRAKAERLDAGRAPTYANDPSLEQVIAAAPTEGWDQVYGNPAGFIDRAYHSLSR